MKKLEDEDEKSSKRRFTSFLKKYAALNNWHFKQHQPRDGKNEFEFVS